MTCHFYDHKTGRRFQADVGSDERQVSIGYTPLDGTKPKVKFRFGLEVVDVRAVVARTIACDEARIIENRTGIVVDPEMFEDMERRAQARLSEIT